MSNTTRRMLQWITILVLIALIGLGVTLFSAHRTIANKRVPLPHPDQLVARLEAEEDQGPKALYWINTASQKMTTSSVMDTLDETEANREFRMSFPAFVLEWADGRLLLVDAGMDEDDARAFGRPLSATGLADPIQPHISVSDALGDARRRVEGILFTHLHADHVGGLDALCGSGQVEASVFMTQNQSQTPNFTTSRGLETIREADCVNLEALAVEPVMSAPGFPGVAIVAAAGHTPGSQLIVARIGSGAEARNVVFTGDIVNHTEAIEFDRAKPLLYRTFVVPEDETRQSSLRTMLLNLHAQYGFALLVSHDERALEAAGLPTVSEFYDHTPN